jgi:TetR/AcrR family transcriptional regulator, lmrAB and yxaGH operons repressor
MMLVISAADDTYDDRHSQGAKMTNDTRASMVRSAAFLIGTQGLHATSFSEVLAASGAPRGSIYHHFPGGKAQLAREAVEWTSEQVLGHQAACPATDSPTDVLAWFIELWRTVVTQSSGVAGCAVAGVTIDVGGEPDFVELARSTFRSWVDLLGRQLAGAGLPPERATRVATTALAAMEGALILCRCEQGAGPLEAIASEILLLA